MTLPIRPVTEDELRGFFTVLEAAFGEDVNDEGYAVEVLTAEPERTLATFDGEDIVATAGAFTFDLVVPGARVPAAGVTYVGVTPTHRRRGLLTALMRRQLDDVRGRGEPVAVLWASEAAIYGRFGYGLASQLLRVEVDRVDAGMRPDLPSDPDVRLRLVPAADVAKEVERIEQEHLGTRPGTFARDSRWIAQLLQDPPSRRDGMSSLQCVLATRGDEPVGYALYRTKPESLRPYMLPDGTAIVMAQTALTPAVDVALTQTVLSLDLIRRVRWWNLPMDTVLPHQLRDPRHARTTALDALHLRLVDVGAALAARRYAAPVDVVIEVADAMCPWNDGRWHLRADRAGASCERTDAEPQVRAPVEALGAAYLGGTTLATLAAAGRVTTTDDRTLESASLAFGWPVAPWCPVIF